MKNVGILLSGRGSNFIALADTMEAGRIAGRVAMVISNKESAAGLAEATHRGYPTRFIPSRGRSRDDFDHEAVAALKGAGVEIVCLAGFMRLLSPRFVHAFPNRILNIHPSLLPSFPGLDVQQQVLDWGGKVSGCTVHLVDEQLDHGPILVQKCVPVREDDTEAKLSARILEQEHQAYPEALQLMCAERVRIEGRRAIIVGPAPE